MLYAKKHKLKLNLQLKCHAVTSAHTHSTAVTHSHTPAALIKNIGLCFHSYLSTFNVNSTSATHTCVCLHINLRNSEFISTSVVVKETEIIYYDAVKTKKETKQPFTLFKHRHHQSLLLAVF